MAQSQEGSGAKNRCPTPPRERRVSIRRIEEMAENSFRDKRREAVFVDALMPEHHCETRLGGGVQACLVSPACRREGDKLAAEAAVHSLMTWATGAGSQGLNRLTGLPVCVGGGRIPILSWR